MNNNDLQNTILLKVISLLNQTIICYEKKDTQGIKDIKSNSWYLSDQAANFIEPYYGSQIFHICAAAYSIIESIYLLTTNNPNDTYTYHDAIKSANTYLKFAKEL